ncbi:MAG TPA: c-type cytochrome [Anaeromyxobacteraceae bacterium]|nr:c-type cytochrome [Anaeromyxobacteraceae bacterium]
MTERMAKGIFWIGTLSSLAVFLAMTVYTHQSFDALTHADALDQKVVSGKRAFERHNCNDCHTILGFGAYYAPDLTRAYARLGEDAVKRRLEAPEVVFADSYRKMPQQHLSRQEVEDLVAFLRWVSNIDNHDWPPQDSPGRWRRSTERVLASASLSPAAALVQQENCLACHALGGAGGSAGPRLEWIGGRRDVDWIARYIADPDAVSHGSRMPPFPHLSEGQRRMIGEFVVSLVADRSTP